MFEFPLLAGAVLIPLGFGLVPGFLPRSVPLFARWALWAVVLAATAAYVAVLADSPLPLQLVSLGSSVLAMMLSLAVLVAETRRTDPGRGQVRS